MSQAGPKSCIMTKTQLKRSMIYRTTLAILTSYQLPATSLHGQTQEPKVSLKIPNVGFSVQLPNLLLYMYFPTTSQMNGGNTENRICSGLQSM